MVAKYYYVKGQGNKVLYSISSEFTFIIRGFDNANSSNILEKFCFLLSATPFLK